MRINFTFIPLFLLLIAYTVGSNAKTDSVISIQHWLSKNDVPIYFVEKKQIPLVDIAVIFRAGSVYDGKHAGIASFTAKMLAEGTTHLSADQIADQFESVGAQFSTQINRDRVAIRLRSLSQTQYLQQAINTLLEILHYSNFPSIGVSRIRKQTLVALQQEAQSPNVVAYKAFFQDLYSKHPYASPILGTAENIQHFNSLELIQFYRSYYHASNAMIIVVGDLSKSQAKNIGEKIAQILPKGQKTLPPSLEHSNPQLFKNIDYPTTQTTIILGQLGISAKDKDYFPLLVGNEILGGGVLTSRLFNEVRNKRGLCYNISSRFDSLEVPGPFLVKLQTRNTQANKALNVTKNVLNKFVEQGPCEHEVSSAKKALIGSFPLAVASNAAVLSILEYIVFYDLPLTYLDEYRNKIQQVTKQQISTAFKKHLTQKNWITVIVAPSREKSSNGE